MGFYPRLRYKYWFPYAFLERAAALLKKFKVPSLRTKSEKAESRKNPVVLDNTMDTDDILAPFKKNVSAKEAVNPSKSILGPIDIAQPIFGANCIMHGITMSADQRLTKRWQGYWCAQVSFKALLLM